MHEDSGRVAVGPEKSLAHPLRLMVELDLIVLPVVDGERPSCEGLRNRDDTKAHLAVRRSYHHLFTDSAIQESSPQG